MKDSLSEQDWRRLIESINRGNCVLVCGPDMVFDPDDPDHTPLTTKLAQHLARKLPADTPDIIRKDLAQVAQLRCNSPGGDHYDLELEVKDFYAPFAKRTSRFHEDLAALPFTLCLSMSYVPFMVNALKDAHKSSTYDFYHYQKHRPTSLSKGTIQHPIVYQLHGDLKELDSLVLTETDLLEFLVNIIKGTHPLPPYIAGQLADPGTSFLFLGFGFQRWYARVLLHVLQTYRHRNRSLAVEGAAFFDHPDSAQSAVFFTQEHKIEFRHYSWSDFASELRRLYEAQAPQAVVREIPPNSPKVFLCYDRRDQERVMEVEQKLHSLGVDTWRDQQDLRGGDDWNRRIVHVLGKQVDYVLVLQTPNMLSKPRSYIHKEIAEALERQKEFDEGESFLIPAILEGSLGLERLDKLQRVELTDPHGLERLASHIQANWVKRQNRIRGD
ncbi:MAG TPA: toll/interleukin-1 receptor domain-containing protein [Candidatus Binatia bacterium]|jgi:hypothetical protein